MSESPQNAEIEDVLSSIRRLVAGSEEASRRRGTETPEDSVGPSRPEDGREDPFDATAPLSADAPPQNAAPALVLTEADRVDPEDASDVDTAPPLPDTGAISAPPHGRAQDAEADGAPSARPPEALFRAASARTAPDAGAAPGAQSPAAPSIAEDEAPENTRRQGFGFGGARRDDPVKHIPLVSRAESGSAGSASPVADGSTPFPSDGALDGQSFRHLAASSAHADEDVDGPPPQEAQEATSTAAPGPKPDSEAAEGPAEAVDPGDAAGAVAPSIAPGQNRRMGPIISEAFAHPPAERVGTAAPMAGENREETAEQSMERAGVPAADGPGHHLEQMSAEAPAADIDGGAPDETPDANAGADAACATPAEDREITSTPEAGDADPSAEPGASAHAAGFASDSPSSPPHDAIVPDPGVPEDVDVAATAVGGEDLRPEAPVAGDRTSVDNLFTDRLDGVDPSLLRRMVRDVVREELEGEIGRRASARIRQLIRDEVRQAFGAHGND